MTRFELNSIPSYSILDVSDLPLIQYPLGAHRLFADWDSFKGAELQLTAGLIYPGHPVGVRWHFSIQGLPVENALFKLFLTAINVLLESKL